MALQEASETAFCLKTILEEILHGSEGKIQIKCFTDNKFLIDSLHSSRTLEEERLILDEAIVKDNNFQRGIINEVKLIDTRNQPVDHLTKATASSESLCDILRQGNSREH